MEACYGCGIRTRGDEQHPVAAVLAAGDVEGDFRVEGEPTRRGFVQVPVCTACHQDPEHRTRVIKGHFFLRADAEAGLRLAGSANVQH